MSVNGSKNPNFKWTDKALKNEALRYSNKKEFRANSQKAYEAAYKRGVLNNICSHMQDLRKNKIAQKWSFEKIKKEALKYKTRFEFQKNSESAYRIAFRNKILDKVCGHMVKTRTIWNKQLLIQEAKKYNKRSDFAKNSNAAYQSAKRSKVLDEICLNMKISSNTSSSETNLFEEIKKVYPKTIKLKIKKKNIVKDKPYIHGFELDIYVPELRKGIEFDGGYWHSLEGLKRGRPNWPQEDLEQYHKIKDNYFKSTKIEILHVDEKEWNRDNKACISKCLGFLRG